MGEASPFPLLALADGAGSAVHSRIGAETAVRTAVDSIREKKLRIDSRSRCLELHEAILIALREAAKELETDLSTLATTFMAVYALEETVYWMQLGDGTIIAQNHSVLGCVSVPCKGEFANETVFVTSPGASDSLQFGSFPAAECDGLLAFTDGLEPLLVYQACLIPAPVCSSLISQLKQKPLTGEDLQHLLENEFCRASDDDKTLGLMVPSLR